MKKFLVFHAVIFFVTSHAQTNNESTLEVHDIVYEKVYLHIDREVYSPRENIWFRVFILSGIDHKPLSGFKNVYVELINKSGKVVDHRLILTHNGAGLGDFNIPYYIDEGQYIIRAYTKYQKNFGEESYFHKKILILTLKQEDEARSSAREKDIDLEFFPEGGNMLMNAMNNVAFKAIDESRRGISVSGHILDDLGDTITLFESEFKGMGSFMLLPKEGRNYIAVLDEYPEYSYLFKNILQDGVSMQIVDEPTQIKLKLYRNYNVLRKDTISCKAYHKGIELFSESIILQADSDEHVFSKSKFPLGISKITLTDASGIILAERICFIKNGFEDIVDIQLEKTSYNSRERVNLQLQSMLPFGDSLLSGVSISVVNRDYLERNGYSMDLRSYLLLDSELKGSVESSASFFTEEQLPSSEKLNLLTLVQGWRSYYWPYIIAKQTDQLVGWDDYGLKVSGWVKKLFGNKIIQEGIVRIGPFSQAFIFLDTITNSDGKFQFERLYLRDSTTLIVEAKNAKGKHRTEVFLMPIYQPEKVVNARMLDKLVLNKEVPYSFYGRSFIKLRAEVNYGKRTDEVWVEKAEEILEQSYAFAAGTYWIEEVVISEKSNFKFSDFSKSWVEVWYGKVDTSIIVRDTEEHYINIFDYLKKNPVKGVYVNGQQITISEGKSPLYMIDSVMYPSEVIYKFPFNEIDEIKIVKKGYGEKAPNGVIAIYRKSADVSEAGEVMRWRPEPDRYIKGRITVEVNGFQTARAFYSPKYTLENVLLDIPDYRPTLFWEPFVFFKDRKADIEFYTSDFTSDYIVIVEGISKNGKICTGIGEFSVGK